MIWRQYAALPWRREADALEVLLITSRETRRWIIPKGWPIRGLPPHKAAAREAFEEAGVTGTIARAAVGFYEYEKRLKTGNMRPCRVAVFALGVTEQHETWPEKGQRSVRWMPVDEAATMVTEQQLADLLRGFSPP